MWLFRVCFTFCLIGSIFCGALAPDRDFHSHAEEGKTLTQFVANKDYFCSGETCTKAEDNDEEENLEENMSLREFLKVTEHTPETRKENKSLRNRARAEDITTDRTKDVIFNKLMMNAGRIKPNKFQGESLIARYVQGVRDKVKSDTAIVEKKVEKNSDDVEGKIIDNEQMHKHMDFMTNFLDMDPFQIVENDTIEQMENDTNNASVDQKENETNNASVDQKENETNNASVDQKENETNNASVDKKENETNNTSVDQMDFMTTFLGKDPLDLVVNREVNSTENEDSSGNLTETQDNRLDFMTNFLDNDPMDIDVNVTKTHLFTEANETESNINTTEIHDNRLDFMTNFLGNDTLDNIEVNETKIHLNTTETLLKETENLENQLDFLTNFLDKDPLDIELIATESLLNNVTEHQDNQKVVETPTISQENQLDFVTDFLNADPFELIENPKIIDNSLDTEASDRSDVVDINVLQEENLDFLTDFLSEDPAALQVNTDLLNVDPAANEISQDILDLYAEDEVKSFQDEITDDFTNELNPGPDSYAKRKKPVTTNNVEWVKEKPKEEASYFWNWLG